MEVDARLLCEAKVWGVRDGGEEKPLGVWFNLELCVVYQLLNSERRGKTRAYEIASFRLFSWER